MRAPSRVGFALLIFALAGCGEQPTTVATPTVPDVDAVRSPTRATDPGPGAESWSEGPSLSSSLGEPVPASVIVSWDGLEWVWASPCALNGCTAGIDIGHDGFAYATEAQFAARPPVEEFLKKCAAPWFDRTWDHCDRRDLLDGFYGSTATGGLPTGNGEPMRRGGETLLVRAATGEPVDDPRTVEDCKKGGWATYGFINQGQCVRFIETGKDSRLG